jgi:transcription initiation factor IIE alpha subunit
MIWLKEGQHKPRDSLGSPPQQQGKGRIYEEIPEAIGLDISTHTDWLRVERSLARILRALVKWGWVACDRRQRDEGHRFWYNAYWKTKLAGQEDSD